MPGSNSGCAAARRPRKWEASGGMAAANSIVDRMSDYFDRQIALYDEMLAAYESLPADLQVDDLTFLTNQQEAFTRRANQLEEELRLLTRDWQNATRLTESEREHVRGLARHAETLAGKLEGLSRDAADRAMVRSREVKQELDALRRGHQTMMKYRGDDDDGAAGYMDTKA